MVLMKEAGEEQHHEAVMIPHWQEITLRRKNAMDELRAGSPQKAQEYLRDLRVEVASQLVLHITESGSVEELWLMPITQHLLGDYLEDCEEAAKFGLTSEPLNKQMVELAINCCPGIIDGDPSDPNGEIIKKIFDPRILGLGISVYERRFDIFKRHYPSITVHGMMGYWGHMMGGKKLR